MSAARRQARLATGGALALDYADRIVLRSVRDVHRGVAARAFGAVDAVAGHRTAPHRLHDGIAESVYAVVARGLRGGSAALHLVDARVPIGPPLEESTGGRFLISAVHGLIGDQMVERAPVMAFELGFRVGGRDVELTPDGIRAGYPSATGDVVVFVHGLCESEDVWHRSARPVRADGEPQPGGYGDRLARAGWTPAYVRANSGLGVGESGVALHAALTRLVEAWPMPVSRLVLVGHSMGGLIIRAALEVRALGQPAPWQALVSDVVTLGTPHLGSHVERAIALGMRHFGEVAELAPYHRIFRHRSAGVLDLALGLPEPPSAWPHIRYRLVAGARPASPAHPLARTVGDLLVTPRSAFATPRPGRRLLAHASELYVPGAHHFDLLNHDAVADAMQRWLAEPAGRGTEPDGLPSGGPQ